MRPVLQHCILLLFFFSGSHFTGFSQQGGMADTTRLEKQLSILNKKLFLQFPAAATISPRVADIMASDPNENRETRIILDNGKMRLVFFAQELFSLAGNDMPDELSKQVEPEFDFQRKVLTDSASLLSVLSTPALFDSTQNGILVNSLTIKSPDNTVSRIDAYINPDAWSLRNEYVNLTEAVFKTLVTGTRTIPLNARTEIFKIPGTNAQFQFAVPEKYFITLDEKYDFSVFKINKYKKLTDDTYTSITIYTGRYPSLFHKEYGFSDSMAANAKGIFLGDNPEWLYFKDDINKFYLKEQISPATELGGGLVFHVAQLTNKKDIMEEMTAIVAKIKLIK